mgnify:CR=1 FL=1
MNYLAHALLSGDNAELLIGNFIADHIRGNQLAQFPPGVVQGVYLHRNIDAFTDSHAGFKKTKRFFYEGFEKHSGILVDIYFDHLLAKNFGQFHPLQLNTFAAGVYKTYEANRHLLPEGSNRFLDYVLSNNIYSSYANRDGIQKVLYHLSHRIKHNVRLDESLLLFTKNEEEISGIFFEFFRDAQKEFNPR